MSKTNSFSGQVFTSHSAALTALIDEKGRDYTKGANDTFYWRVKSDQYGDGPYAIRQTQGGKWVIL